MSKQPKDVKANPTNSESSGANRVGVANSGQNQFPLKEEAREDAEQNTKQKGGMPSAGSRARQGAENVDPGTLDNKQ